MSHFLIVAKTETTEVNSVLEWVSRRALKGLEFLGFRTLVALLSGPALDYSPTVLKENLDRK